MNLDHTLVLIIKTFMIKYGPIVAATLFGAVAHACEEVRKTGWKGWFSFISDLLVCSFVGYSFFHLSILIYPAASIIFTSLGSYWGTKGYVLIKNWVINSIKANIK